MDIAYAMLSDNHGLLNWIQKPFSDLTNYKGIGKEKALRISATFEIAKRFSSLQSFDNETINEPEQIYKKYLPILSFSNQEQVFLIILNKKKKIIHEVNLYKGTSRAVTFSISQIIQQILMHGGYYFYIIHNHPSGDLLPSKDDTFLTSDLIMECKKVNVFLVDHLIIGPSGYFSFKDSKAYEIC